MASFSRYWNDPEATAEKVCDGWLLTGDLATQDADGFVWFHSRKDDVIICSGYRIGPAEIEDCLAAHPAVADAGVVGVPDETRGEIPKAFVVLAAGETPSDALRETLQTHVKDTLAKYEYPRELVFIDDLPKTTNGKLKRSQLHEL
jgi:acetyl-CoA synthetase